MRRSNKGEIMNTQEEDKIRELEQENIARWEINTPYLKLEYPLFQIKNQKFENKVKNCYVKP